jgi:hypothetical protein
VLPDGTFVSMFWIIFSVEDVLAASFGADAMKFDGSQRSTQSNLALRYPNGRFRRFKKHAPGSLQHGCSIPQSPPLFFLLLS